MVAVGTLISATWIISANSWMQTPAGYTTNAAGQFVPVDWWAVIFNPSFPYRLVHMVLAAYLTTAFVVGGVGAWHLLRDRANAEARLMFSMAMWMATIVAPIQLVAGDMHGLNTLQHQPAKIAALEGHFETQRGAPLLLFGWPDMEAERTRYAVGIPHLGSLILTHEWNGEIKGLKDFPKEDRPDATIVFWSFRVMVGIGMLMIGLGLLSLLQRLRRKLYQSRALLWLGVLMGPAGFAAVLAGWITTEVGRQPFVVYGLLRTKDAVAPIAAPAVATSLIAFVLVYLALFGAGLFYTMRLMMRPPTPAVRGPDPRQPQHAAGIMPGPAQQAGEGGTP
jgi:cytochrome d ubiquinol oxidase subunit I